MSLIYYNIIYAGFRTLENCKMLFFSRRDSETRDHLRFASLSLIEQQQFCSVMTGTVTTWRNKLILLLKTSMSSGFYLQAFKEKFCCFFFPLFQEGEIPFVDWLKYSLHKPVNDAEILVSLMLVGSLLLALLGRFDSGQVFSYKEE